MLSKQFSLQLQRWRSRTGRNRSRILRLWYELVLENKEHFNPSPHSEERQG